LIFKSKGKAEIRESENKIFMRTFEPNRRRKKQSTSLTQEFEPSICVTKVK
jgi:hypothetical protein